MMDLKALARLHRKAGGHIVYHNISRQWPTKICIEKQLDSSWLWIHSNSKLDSMNLNRRLCVAFNPDKSLLLINFEITNWMKWNKN